MSRPSRHDGLCEALGPVEAEFSALPFPPFSAIQRLLDAGMPAGTVGALHGDHALKVARVEITGRRWEPEGPDPRLLIGVRDLAGEMIDIVALARHAPRDWALRTGEAVVLGEETMERAGEEACVRGRAALRVFADPWAWLMAGCVGICVLDWNRAAPCLRQMGERVLLVCDTGEARGTLARLTRGGVPRVAEVQTADAALSLAERIGREAA